MGSPVMHIKGIRPPDEEYQQYKAVYDACRKAGVPVPDRVLDFFDYQEPSPNGILTDLDLSDAVKSYEAVEREGFEVELAKLPKNITHLRFYLSW